MKNQASSLGFEIQWEISMYMCFMCYALAFFIFPMIQNSYAGNFCTGLKPTDRSECVGSKFKTRGLTIDGFGIMYES